MFGLPEQHAIVELGGLSAPLLSAHESSGAGVSGVAESFTRVSPFRKLGELARRIGTDERILHRN